MSCFASTGTGIIEAKLAQQLAHLKQMPFFGVFIDLRKAFDAMDCGQYIEILALHGVGPKMLCLIRNSWDSATNISWTKGNYGQPFKTGRGVTQGGPLSAKLFNIVVNAVVWEWMRLMHTTINNTDGNLAECITGLFVVFYVKDGYIASCDAEFLQEALNILVKTFKHIGLTTNTKKTQAMVCTPGKIRVQLPTDSYKRMCEGVAAGEESQRVVVCHVCNKALQARSLRPHLLSAHDIHQQVVVADVLLEERAGVHYRAIPGGQKDPIQCRTQGAQVCSAVPTCCAAISGINTQKTPWKSRGRGNSCGASVAQCSVSRGSCGTSTHRCACWVQSNGHSGTWPSRRPWLCVSCSM